MLFSVKCTTLITSLCQNSGGAPWRMTRYQSTRNVSDSDSQCVSLTL